METTTRSKRGGLDEKTKVERMTSQVTMAQTAESEDDDFESCGLAEVDAECEADRTYYQKVHVDDCDDCHHHHGGCCHKSGCGSCGSSCNAP